MSVDAFFAWQDAQAERYDRVGVVVHCRAPLRIAPCGLGCRPFTGDAASRPFPVGFATQISIWIAGRVIATGRGTPGRLSSSKFSLQALAASMPSRRLPKAPSSRAGTEARFLGLDATASRPVLDIMLPADEIDDGVSFPLHPRLVPGEPGTRAG